MASELFEKWLVHYDSIHRGYTPSGMANGVTATGGWTFPRVSGGTNLYRGVDDASAIDFDNPVGAAGASASSIGNFSWWPHAVSTRYVYAVRSIGGGGVESAASHPARVAEFDGAGALLDPRPNGLGSLSVSSLAGGAFVLRWVYPSRFEESVPSVFEVYHDNGTGTVDYQTVVASVSYRRGQIHYSFTSGAFTHGVRRIWGVRAVSAAGVDDGNTLTAMGWSDAQGPAVHPSIAFSCLPEES